MKRLEVGQWLRCRRVGRVIRNAALASAALLVACAVEVENTRPAAQLARESAPPGSAYAGWRVFNDRCARCHGADATGSAVMPDLLDRVRYMGERRFVDLVLLRYDWRVPAADGASESAAREAFAEQVLRRRDTPLEMPAWQDQPQVNARILDLYAYLSARADGALGPGRPAR